MYVVFDTETTRLPRDKRAPASDFENWPRIVQLARIENWRRERDSDRPQQETFDWRLVNVLFV